MTGNLQGLGGSSAAFDVSTGFGEMAYETETEDGVRQANLPEYCSLFMLNSSCATHL